MDGDAFLHLSLRNNTNGRVKKRINDILLLNQSHVVNHPLKKIMCLMRLGDTNTTRLDIVLYCVYKTHDNMEEHAPNISTSHKYSLLNITKIPSSSKIIISTRIH